MVCIILNHNNVQAHVILMNTLVKHYYIHAAHAILRVQHVMEDLVMIYLTKILYYVFFKLKSLATDVIIFIFFI